MALNFLSMSIGWSQMVSLMHHDKERSWVRFQPSTIRQKFRTYRVLHNFVRLLLPAVEQGLFRRIFLHFRFPHRTGNDPNIGELSGQVAAEDLQPVPEVPVVVKILEKLFRSSHERQNQPKLRSRSYKKFHHRNWLYVGIGQSEMLKLATWLIWLVHFSVESNSMLELSL